MTPLRWDARCADGGREPAVEVDAMLRVPGKVPAIVAVSTAPAASYCVPRGWLPETVWE